MLELIEAITEGLKERGYDEKLHPEVFKQLKVLNELISSVIKK